ncbi:MAG: hypothetical protein IID39_04475, partial [Planctomycetes bacterium]|nr:hypothetical protein [Planctomycetota bacterium]
MKPIAIGSVTPTSGEQRGVWDVLFFSWANNVWFGIGVLAAIFVYSSLGSAVPPLRQHPWLEMTEMEWFGWWPFELMIALMCINMTVVTIRQIPLQLVNAGVWSIHAGIILLAVGSVYYFGTKQEGDIPVYRRRATINVPGAAAPVTMLIRPGNHVTANGDSGEYHFSVSQIFPEWRISSGADAGKTTYAVWISVETPTERFTRQLLAGFPHYTEDILSSGQRAKKVRGEPLVDPSLIMSLDYEPQDRFFLMDSSAVYVRDVGDPEWLQRPIEGLPHYHERIRSPDDVLLAPGEEPPPLRPIDIPLDAAGPDDPLADYDVRVTAFLRYAFFSATWLDGGARLNPVARLVLDGAEFGAVDHELVAFDAKRNTAEDGQIVFRWFRTPEELEQLASGSESYLAIRVPDAGVDL